MRKLIIGLLFILNVVIITSCEVDKCPQHGQNTVPANHQPHRA